MEQQKQRTETVNINTLISETEKVNDLRKKETLRIIAEATKVCRRLAELSKSSPGEVMIQNNVGSTLAIYGDPAETNRWMIASGGEINIVNISMKGSKYEWIGESTVIAYAPETWRIGYRISDGKYPEFPSGKIIYMPEQRDRIVGGSETKVFDTFIEPEKWMNTLEKVEKEPDSIPRNWWILVARHLVALSQDMKDTEEIKETATREAADLAEKLAKAIQ